LSTSKYICVYIFPFYKSHGTSERPISRSCLKIGIFLSFLLCISNSCTCWPQFDFDLQKRMNLR